MSYNAEVIGELHAINEQMEETNARLEKLTSVLLIMLAYNRGERYVVNPQRIREVAQGTGDIDWLIDQLCGPTREQMAAEFALGKEA